MTALPLGEGVGLDQQANLQILVIGTQGSKPDINVYDRLETHHYYDVIPSAAWYERSEGHAKSRDLVFAPVLELSSLSRTSALA